MKNVKRAKENFSSSFSDCKKKKPNRNVDLKICMGRHFPIVSRLGELNLLLLLLCLLYNITE